MGDMLCTGTIVDQIHIITAASCLQQDGIVPAIDSIKAFVDSDRAWQGRELQLASLDIHPEYAEDKPINDLAVITLAPGQVDYKVQGETIWRTEMLFVKFIGKVNTGLI
jgi:secreted trypsin-like serine protease